MTPEFAAQPRSGSGDVRAARRGRRQPDRPAAAPEHHHVHPLRARLRRAARGLDPDRAGRRRRSPTARWRTAARRPPPSGSAPSRSIFPSDHGGFLGGEYGQTRRPGRLRREAARGPRRGLSVRRAASGLARSNTGSGQAPGDELGAAFERVVTACGHAAVQLEEVRSIDDEDPADGPDGQGSPWRSRSHRRSPGAR